jgi:dolichyl-phosphate beta-glucosyltransferase
MKKLTLVIPAHNEQNRITRTLEHYAVYFKHYTNLDVTLLVVNNASSDNTIQVVQEVARAWDNIMLLDLDKPGKGRAIVAGFAHAATTDADYIGFVDADMATQPEYFYALITNMENADGCIASRYIPGAQVYPARPWIKYWGRKLVYDNLVYLLFGLPFYDLQCGAKVFKSAVIKAIVHECTIKQWAFDVELLYLCKKYKFTIREIPTVWYDQADSKLQLLRSGTRMLGSVMSLRLRHSPMKFLSASDD